ncbi:MAG: hypothetical protein B7Z78_07755 [Rhodospirillales bacterium 20-60-12]|nr:MAG: hypothetical protein B7Z78_07755 [Rhodospirillales bacterium 20-60-12]
MSKHTLWLLLGLAAFFVFITNEVFLIADYPLYHQYRVHLIADRYLLFPHALFGTLALLSGPLQFSTRLRRQYISFHRILGRLYVLSVASAAVLAMIISAGHPLFAGTTVQASAWIICTFAAFLTARNRHITQHRQWMVRSYAITFTFITLRLLSIWPAYWNLPDATNVIIIISTTFGSILLADLGLNWRELAHRRS